MFRIGDAVFTHANAIVVMTPRRAGASGSQQTFYSAKSFEGDANVEAFFVEGTSHEAVAIGVGVAKPDFKIGGVTLEEILDYAARCGPGYQEAHHDITLTLKQGSKVATAKWIDAVIEKGWGLKTESGSNPNNEISGKARRFELNGIGGFSQPGSGKSLGGGLSVGASVSIGGVSLGVKLSF